MYKLKDLPNVRGPLLDAVAAELGLPGREIIDPTGYTVVWQSDDAYLCALADALESVAANLRKAAK